MYAAGETPIDGVDQYALRDAVIKNGVKASALDSDADLLETLKSKKQPGDLVIFMGAGTITNFAYNSYEQISNK